MATPTTGTGGVFSATTQSGFFSQLKKIYTQSRKNIGYVRQMIWGIFLKENFVRVFLQA